MAEAGFFRAVADFLYPREAVCVTCGALRVDDPCAFLCARCAKALTPLEGPFCDRCGMPGWLMVCPDCHTRPPDALDARCSAFAYEGTAEKLVRALKYQGVAHAAEALADGMAAVMPTEPPEAIVPVPLHRLRERVRGFNQAMLLAEALAGRTGLPILPAVSRVRATVTQTRLSQAQRETNVRGAFRAEASVLGLSLVLIDDVLTTGATALSCAEALKEAGARRVTLVTAARAIHGRE